MLFASYHSGTSIFFRNFWKRKTESMPGIHSVWCHDKGLEIKHRCQVANGTCICWQVRIGAHHCWIWPVVTAAIRQRRQFPVALDKLHHRRMIMISVINVVSACIRRYDQEWNTWAITKE